MTTSNSSLLLHAYAPPLTDEDRRPLVVVEAMERAMPRLRLGWIMGDQGAFIAAPEGSARRAARARDGGLALYCNGDNDHLVTLTGWEVPANLTSGRQPHVVVFAKWPMDAASITTASDVLEQVALKARAYWGHVTPSAVTDDLAEQTKHTPTGPLKSPRGLPMLEPELRSAKIPRHVGWLNYWSAMTASAIGFPDPARDAELLARSRRTEAGGWLVRLTDAPLDLDDPAHLQALLQAYERFPKIGGRDAS